MSDDALARAREDCIVERRVDAWFGGALAISFKSHHEGRPNEPMTTLYRSSVLEGLGVDSSAPRPTQCVTKALVRRIADEVRERLQVESSSDRYQLGQRSRLLDGVDAMEEAILAALAARVGGQP